MQSNIFHIHNKCCNHSTNEIDCVLQYSLKNNYKKLYFTEHNYCPINCYYAKRRPKIFEIKKLRNKIINLNKKYYGKIKLYFGYEMEFNWQNKIFFEKLARDQYADFLIFGNHFYGNLLKTNNHILTKYSTNLSRLSEFEKNQYLAMSSKLFSWVAHPDIFLYSYAKWDKNSYELSKKIISWSQKFNLPLGFNVNFPAPFNKKNYWHYPVKDFWKLVSKTNIPVIIESDSHDMHSIEKQWLIDAKKLAISYGLKNNLTQSIKLNLLPKKPQLFLIEKSLYNEINTRFLNDLKKENIPIHLINLNSNINKIIQRYKKLSMFTCVFAKNKKLVEQIKKTSIFHIEKIKNINYKHLLTEFVSAIN